MNELDLASGAKENGESHSQECYNFHKNCLKVCILEALFYNEVVSDASGELFNTKVRDSAHTFYESQSVVSYNLYESRNRLSCKLHLSTTKNAQKLYSYSGCIFIHCDDNLLARTFIAID